MSNLHDDLRSTEESIRSDAEQVTRLEDQKASMDPADPRVVELSEHIEHIAAGLRGKTIAERELSQEIQDAK
jgi:hypothetical protein